MVRSYDIYISIHSSQSGLAYPLLYRQLHPITHNQKCPDPQRQLRQTDLLANWKCLLICCVVSMANLEFGIDSGEVGSLQAMPGFLAVFGV